MAENVLNREVRMEPLRERYIHLVYLAILYMQPALGTGRLLDWVLAIALSILFAAWYLGTRTLKAWHPWLIITVGFAAGFANAGASVFYVYAAFMLGGLYKGRELWRVLGAVAAIVVGQGVLLFLIHDSLFASMSHAISLVMLAFAGVVSVSENERAEVNRRLRLANEQIGTVSRMAERERIARDMHDVVGHTLSVVVLKSELAGKLFHANPERAAAEIRDVEQLARSALRDVRAAISGYRERGFEGELANARLALEAADIRLAELVDSVDLQPETEQVLALLLREAITNVLRHSDASNCTVKLSRTAEGVTLEVSDDGQGGPVTEGDGLKGMRERLEAVGGWLVVDTARGMRLSATVPE